MDHILEVRNLKKYYAAHKAVDDISFDIPVGSIFGLLGPNGAGKTTLLRMITGIFYPDSGDITFNGKPFDPVKDVSFMGYMPEERGLYKKMQIGEQLIYLAQLKGLVKSEAKNKAMFWIRKFELSNWWNKKVGDLSKGMQQKVQFISTIMHEPRLLILDEPFSGLDPLNTNIIKQEIYDLCNKGTTVIFSTHRMEQVEEICKHIVLVNNGKKILDGQVNQIKEDFKKKEFSLTLDQAPSETDTETDIFITETIKGNRLVVKLKSENDSNKVLEYFMKKGYSILAFNEILPSINEVFIELVQK